MGPFGSEFSASVISARSYDGLKSQDLEILLAIFALFWKNPPYGKIFKNLFRKFSPGHRSTLLCSNIVKFVRR